MGFIYVSCHVLYYHGELSALVCIVMKPQACQHGLKVPATGPWKAAGGDSGDKKSPFFIFT